jgi:hypothetical protein
MHIAEPPDWLVDLPGIWRGPFTDAGAVLVVCDVCRAGWYTALGAFSERAIAAMHRHGQQHARPAKRRPPQAGSLAA